MPKLPSSRQIESVLLGAGFVFVSQKGSHAKYRKSGHVVIVPKPKKEIPLGTLRSIVRQSGLSMEDFKS